jgi:hypothetical protein
MFQKTQGSSSLPCAWILQRFNGPGQCFQPLHLESAVLARPGGEAPGVFELVFEIVAVAASPGSQDSSRYLGDTFFLGDWFRPRHADRIEDRAAGLKEIAGKSTL